MLRIVLSKEQIKSRISRDFFEKKNMPKLNKFKRYLFNKGIVYPNNGIIFFSAANTKKQIIFITKIISDGLIKIFK